MSEVHDNAHQADPIYGQVYLKIEYIIYRQNIDIK